MRNTRIVGTLLAVTAVAMVVSTAAQRATVRSKPASAVPMPTKGTAVQLTFGLKDTQPTDWDGEIKVSAGKIAHLDAALDAEAKIQGHTWKLRSQHQGGPNSPVRPVYLLAVFDGPATTKVDVTTPQGRFAFTLSDLVYGRPTAALDGAAAVERMPLSAQITNQPTEDDFPALASAADGTIWCAYVAYQNGNPIQLEEVRQGKFDSLVTKGNGDQIRLLGFDGKTWSAPMDVTKSGLDVWRPTLTVDGQGQVWVIWSQSVDGNWDLYARRYQPKSQRWSDAQRLTQSPGADINVAATTDRAGRVWIAWQGWTDTSFRLMRMKLDERARAEPVTVGSGEGNNWSPSIAADSKGRVFIAWDHYAEGSYNISLEVIDTQTNESRRVPVTRSPLFQARPSLAVDKQDRVWIAYEESDANWGKDFGTKWTGKSGVPFYADTTGKGRRDIRVRVLAGDQLMQPAGDLDANMSERMRIRKSFPRLGVDAAGRVWMAFRHHGTNAYAGVAQNTWAQELWSGWATYYDGQQWAAPRGLPNSTNLLDNRPGLAPWPGGGALIVYSSDGRTGNTTTAKKNDLHAALLQADGALEPAALVAATAPEYRADPVHPNEAADIARMRGYRARRGDRTYQLLRGEFHRHTEYSSHRDQDGPLEEIWRYGLDVARMDWIGNGDHDNGVGANGVSREYTWWLVQKQSDIYHHAPTFIPMFTYERSVVYPSGHRNVMIDRRGIRPLPRSGTPQQSSELLFGTKEGGAPDVKNLYAFLKRFGGICSSHTSATNMGTDWRDNDPEVEPVVEIYQGHRQSYEEPKAPQAAKDAEDSVGGYQPDGFIWNAFRKGYRLGFQVSSDHVSTHLSYGIVYAEQPTRAGILDGFRKRHSYGAQDNIVLDVHCGDRIMGDEFTLKTPPKLDIRVIGTAPVARVDVIRQIDRAGPTYVHAFEPNRPDVTLTWMDNAARPGAVNMYYVRVQQADGKMAWASPLWVKYEP